MITKSQFLNLRLLYFSAKVQNEDISYFRGILDVLKVLNVKDDFLSQVSLEILDKGVEKHGK